MKSFAEVQYDRMLLTTGAVAIVTFVMSLADTVFAGQLFGEECLAGVNLFLPLNSLVAFVSSVASIGICLSRLSAIGRCDRRTMDLCSSTGLWTALAAGVVFGLLYFVQDAYYGYLGVTGSARSVARAYFGGYWTVLAITPLFNAGSSFVLSDGGHRHARLALIVNVVLKLSLSVPLAKALGVGGLALATFIGMAAAILVLSFHLRTPGMTLRFGCGFSWRLLLSGSAAAVIDQLYMFGDMLKMLVVNLFVVARFGEAFLPVVSAFAAVTLFSVIQSATANALQPIVTVYFGEGNYRIVRGVTGRGFRFTVALTFAVSVIVCCFPSLVTTLLGMSDPRLLPEAYKAVRIAGAFLVFSQIAGYMDSYYIYVDRRLLAGALVVLDSCVVPAVLGVVLGMTFGGNGLWSGLSLAPGVVSGVALLVLYLRFGRGNAPFLLSSERDAKLYTYDLEVNEREVVAASEAVMKRLQDRGLYHGAAVKAPLIVEETLMIIRERNRGKKVLAEVTLDLNDGIALTLRDDGEIFDLTDSDADISSLRAYIVGSIMSTQQSKINLTTTGFNRNVFRF